MRSLLKQCFPKAYVDKQFDGQMSDMALPCGVSHRLCLA